MQQALARLQRTDIWTSIALACVLALAGSVLVAPRAVTSSALVATPIVVGEEARSEEPVSSRRPPGLLAPVTQDQQLSPMQPLGHGPGAHVRTNQGRLIYNGGSAVLEGETRGQESDYGPLNTTLRDSVPTITWVDD